jgi:hypothetical protein
MSQIGWGLILVVLLEPFQMVPLSRQSVPWVLSYLLFSICQTLSEVQGGVSQISQGAILVALLEPF